MLFLLFVQICDLNFNYYRLFYSQIVLKADLYIVFMETLFLKDGKKRLKIYTLE